MNDKRCEVEKKGCRQLIVVLVRKRGRYTYNVMNGAEIKVPMAATGGSNLIGVGAMSISPA